MKIGGVTYLTVKDAARALGVTPKTVQEWINRGIIDTPPKVAHGLKHVQVFTIEAIEEARRRLESYKNSKDASADAGGRS
jgi:predicted site-specific integrase-resolvase